MFADACSKAIKFTRPVIISTKNIKNEVTASCGAFTIINDEGWVITAAHIFDSFVQYQNDQNKIKEVDEINRKKTEMGDFQLTDKDPMWLTNHSFWWGQDGAHLTDVYVNRQIDLAVGRLTPFNPRSVDYYPKFRDPSTIKVGTSLCRLGFPFVNVETEYDFKNNAFRIANGVLPLSFYPNDGIHTRIVNNGKSKDGDFELMYVETSTPGFKGQSGGPIFDKDCYIYGLQVQTAHLPLGFQPTVEMDGKRTIEHQFINVGLGVHPKTIMDVLKSRKIKYSMQGEESGFRILD